MLLLRDVTEVRKRDRLLLSKDATIREIHHRVKNNLQTISSLLRLQGRRLCSAEAKAAVAESVRRIRTIALVHETLSREPGDDVAFIEIVPPADAPRRGGPAVARPAGALQVQGDGGRLPATIATPLSVVLTELLQNAVDHGFPEGSCGGDVVVRAGATTAQMLGSRVVNDGAALDPGFELNKAHRARPVDRAHARHDRARRDDRDAGRHAADFEAVGLDRVRPGAGAVVDLMISLT